MADKTTLIEKAEALRALHHDSRLLILPNVWDPLGARLLEYVGYPAVATASAAVAYARGLDDGQVIEFERMLDVIGQIASAVGVPVTADVEQGYADDAGALADNMRRVIHAGAVGVNIEDSIVEGGRLRDVESQCERLRAVRDMATNEGVPLVINARIDVYLRSDSNTEDERLDETIARSRAYAEAGADCVYPITLSDKSSLAKLYDAIKMPINVYATPSTPSLKELEALGVSRFSVGAGLLKASVTAMRHAAEQLKAYGNCDVVTKNVIAGGELSRIALRKDEQ